MIRWGILGAGNIAHRFAKSLAAEPAGELYAISGRHQERLDAFAQQYPCEKKYLSYQDLLADPDIDAIYLALPHGLHKEWTVKALNKHIAVLCEKPAAMNAAEVREIQKASVENNTLFMEAMKSRFEPAYREILAEVKKGIIGDIEKIRTVICFDFPKEAYGMTYHTDAIQGGALLDSGIYCASLLDDLLKGNPVVKSVEVKKYTNGIDLYTHAFLQFDNGIGEIEVGMDRNKQREAIIYGSKGTIRIPDFHRPSEYYVNDEKMEIPYPVDDFYPQIHHFTELLGNKKTESDIMPLSASIRMAEILDIIKNEEEKL